LIAAAGYMINDLFDIDIDRINKPEKVMINHLFSKNFVIITYSLFNIIALLCGLLIGNQIFIIFIFSIILLILYSAYLKKELISGNLAVSVLLAMTVFIIWIYCPYGNFGMLLFYTSFAFISSFIREIVKDMEDIDGDKELRCHTLPIIAGMKAAKYIALFLTVLLIGLIEYSALFSHVYFYANSIITTISLNFLTVIPLIFIWFKLLNAKERKDYSRISIYMKLVILTGILSIISLKINYPI